MKKILLTLLLCGVVVFGYSQQRTILRNQFSTWSISGNIGANIAKTDVNDKKSQVSTVLPKANYGLTISKQMSHFMALEFSYNQGSAGTKYKSFDYVSNFSQIDGRLKLGLTNGQILANHTNTQIYGFVGIGAVNYSINLDSAREESTDWVHVIPVGVGFKNKLGKRTSVNLDFSYNALNTDRFDGIEISSSERDGYMRVNVGIQYTLGKKKPLEWDKYTEYFKPLDEHSVDTVFVVNHNVDTLYIKFIADSAIMKPSGGGDNLNFDFNKWDIKNKYFESLDDLSLKMLNGEVKTLVIDGHADNVGSEKNNVLVSKLRAEAVKNYLISKGVDENRIQINYHGSKSPISDDDTSLNRRVELDFKN